MALKVFLILYSVSYLPYSLGKVATLADPWALYEFGDPTIPIYTKEDIRPLMKLCIDPSKPDGNERCPAVPDPINCIDDCNPKTLENLVRVKAKVQGIRNHMSNMARTTFLWVAWFTICFGGIYLNVMNHYRFVNLPLPIIGDDLLDSPTDGIKYNHYMWMKWIILGNTNCHWSTYMEEDTTIYHWKPLAEHKWDRPASPEENRVLEPRDEDQPPWTIDDINKEMSGSNEWARIEEYWNRINSWAWARYRHRRPPPSLLDAMGDHLDTSSSKMSIMSKKPLIKKQ